MILYPPIQPVRIKSCVEILSCITPPIMGRFEISIFPPDFIKTTFSRAALIMFLSVLVFHQKPKNDEGSKYGFLGSLENLQ